MPLEIFGEPTITQIADVDFGAAAEADFNAAVDLALNTAIPGTNTADSANDILLDQLKPRLPAAGTIATTADLITSGDILCFRAVVTSGGATTGFVASTMASYGVSFFVGWTAYIVCDTAGAAPAREFRVVEAYTTASGTFAWTPVLSAALANGDIVYLIHPSIDLTIIGLDHLLALTDGANNYPNNAVVGSVIAKMISKAAAGATPSGFDCTTDSLEAISDALSAGTGASTALGTAKLNLLLQATDGTASTLAAGNVADGSIIAKLASKAANGATPEAFDCTTDSLEMLSDKLGAFTGDGGTDMGDSVKANLDLIHTDVDSAIAAPAAALAAVAYTKQAGVMQVKAFALNFNQAAGAWTLATESGSQAIGVEAIVVRCPNSAAAAALVNFKVHTNDTTTVPEFISTTDGVYTNCTANAQIGSALASPIIIPAGGLIQYTLAGNNGAAYAPVAYVWYRAIVSGGYLA